MHPNCGEVVLSPKLTFICVRHCSPCNPHCASMQVGIAQQCHCVRQQKASENRGVALTYRPSDVLAQETHIPKQLQPFLPVLLWFLKARRHVMILIYTCAELLRLSQLSEYHSLLSSKIIITS